MRNSPKSEVRSPELNRLRVIFMLFGILLGSCNSGTKKVEPVKQSDESGVPKFVVSEEMHNFGSLNSGEVVSFTFIFRNEGTKTLIIDRADADCGCIELIIPEKSIAPGNEGSIEIIFNSSGEVGKVLKTITITSNAEQARQQFIMKANITSELIKIHS